MTIVQVENGWGVLNRRDDGSPGGPHGKVSGDFYVFDNDDSDDDKDDDFDNDGDDVFDLTIANDAQWCRWSYTCLTLW